MEKINPTLKETDSPFSISSAQTPLPKEIEEAIDESVQRIQKNRNNTDPELDFTKDPSLQEIDWDNQEIRIQTLREIIEKLYNTTQQSVNDQLKTIFEKPDLCKISIPNQLPKIKEGKVLSVVQEAIVLTLDGYYKLLKTAEKYGLFDAEEERINKELLQAEDPEHQLNTYKEEMEKYKNVMGKFLSENLKEEEMKPIFKWESRTKRAVSLMSEWGDEIQHKNRNYLENLKITEPIPQQILNLITAIAHQKNYLHGEILMKEFNDLEYLLRECVGPFYITYYVGRSIIETIRIEHLLENIGKEILKEDQNLQKIKNICEAICSLINTEDIQEEFSTDNQLAQVGCFLDYLETAEDSLKKSMQGDKKTRKRSVEKGIKKWDEKPENFETLETMYIKNMNKLMSFFIHCVTQISELPQKESGYLLKIYFKTLFLYYFLRENTKTFFCGPGSEEVVTENSKEMPQERWKVFLHSHGIEPLYGKRWGLESSKNFQNYVNNVLELKGSLNEIIKKTKKNPDQILKFIFYIELFECVNHEKIPKDFLENIENAADKKEVLIWCTTLRNTALRTDMKMDYLGSPQFLQYLKKLNEKGVLDEYFQIFGKFYIPSEKEGREMQHILLNPCYADLIAGLGQYFQIFKQIIEDQTRKNLIVSSSKYGKIHDYLTEFFIHYPEALELFTILKKDVAQKFFQKANTKFFKQNNCQYFGKLLNLIKIENGAMEKANEILSFAEKGDFEKSQVLLTCKENELQYWEEVKKILQTVPVALLRNVQPIYSKKTNSHVKTFQISGNILHDENAFLKAYHLSKIYPQIEEDEKKGISEYSRGSLHQELIESLHVLHERLGAKSLKAISQTNMDSIDYRALISLLETIKFDGRQPQEIKLWKEMIVRNRDNMRKIIHWNEMNEFEKFCEQFSKADSPANAEKIIKNIVKHVEGEEFQKMLEKNKHIFEINENINAHALTENQRRMLQQIADIHNNNKSSADTIIPGFIANAIFENQLLLAETALELWNIGANEETMLEFLEKFENDESVKNNHDDIEIVFEKTEKENVLEENGTSDFLKNNDKDIKIERIDPQPLKGKRVLFVAGEEILRRDLYPEILKKLGMEDCTYIDGWDYRKVKAFQEALEKVQVVLIFYQAAHKIYTRKASEGTHKKSDKGEKISNYTVIKTRRGTNLEKEIREKLGS